MIKDLKVAQNLLDAWERLTLEKEGVALISHVKTLLEAQAKVTEAREKEEIIKIIDDFDKHYICNRHGDNMACDACGGRREYTAVLIQKILNLKSR